jgi:transposase
VDILRQVWLQQFYATPPDKPVRWRKAADLPPSSQAICTPHDAQARYAQKRQTIWIGYKVHLTETCDAEAPHLITDVQTTVATAADVDQVSKIQADLATRGLSPAEQIVDAGYVSSHHLLTSQQVHGIDLVGPMPGNQSWQARAQQGYATTDFILDWPARQARCPQGQTSTKWVTTHDPQGHPVELVRFAPATCQPCPVRTACTRSTKGGRVLSMRPQADQQVLAAARVRQLTPDFQALYATRAGIEGTLSQAVRLAGLRRARYIGLAKTHLQHLLTATAVNLLRVAAWLIGRPLARTRKSPFASLGRAPALA